MWPHMTAGDGSRSFATAQLWPNLPKDLLSEVYARLDAPLDRVCFAATCSSWHAFASTHLPWLILDPSSLGDTNHVRCYCPQDGTVLLHVPFPIKDTRRRLVGCHNGGWVVSYEASSLRIVNLFSGEVAPSEKQRKMVRSGQRISTGGRKIIFSEPPTSSGCTLAAITYTDDVPIYRLGRLEAGWTTQELNHEEKLIDIAFYNRELYGLTRHTGRLIKIKISVKRHDEPVITTFFLMTIPNQYPESRFDGYGRYLVGLPDKLIMVTRNRRWGSWSTNRPFFTVLELVEDDTGMKSSTTYKWVEATSLGDHALFLGLTCSKAVRGVKKNHIYYCHHSSLSHLGVIHIGAKVLPTNSGGHVYYKEDESMGENLEGITSEGYYVCGAEPPLWLLPPDV